MSIAGPKAGPAGRRRLNLKDHPTSTSLGDYATALRRAAMISS